MSLDPDGAPSGPAQAAEVDPNSSRLLLSTGLEQLLSEMELATQPTFMSQAIRGVLVPFSARCMCFIDFLKPSAEVLD